MGRGYKGTMLYRHPNGGTFTNCWGPRTYPPVKRAPEPEPEPKAKRAPKKRPTREGKVLPKPDQVTRHSIVDTSNGKLVSREDDGAGWEPKWTKRISEARSFKTKKEAESYVSTSLPDHATVEVRAFVVDFTAK